MTTSVRGAQANQGVRTTLLKTSLVAGSILATLWGAHLLGQVDAGQAGMGSSSTTTVLAAPVQQPVPQAFVPNLAQGSNAIDAPNLDMLLNLELPAIPTIQIPAARSQTAVTRSRSSR